MKQQRVIAFRFAGRKRRIVQAVFGSRFDVSFAWLSGLRFEDFPETSARAAAALTSARSQRRLPVVNAMRLRLFGWQYNYWRRHFDTAPDSIAVTWNGLVSARHIFMLAARDAGARTLFLERGPLPNTLTADPVGVNFRNGLPREAAPYLAWLARHPEADGAWRPHAEALRQRPATVRHAPADRPAPPLDGPFVFLPLQKPGDTQLRFFGRRCTGVPETVAYVAAAAAALPPGWHIRLKQHPSDTTRLSQLLRTFGALPLYLDNETDTFSQVRASRLVLTVNSSVGLEAMLLGARVGVMGDAFWALPGAVASAGTSELLQALLANPDAAPADPDLRNALLSFLVADYYPRLTAQDGHRFLMPEADISRVLSRIRAGHILAADGSTP